MIDSGMWSNENFAALPAMARLLQVGIINHADDQGRIKAHPAYLRSQIFPYDDVTIGDVQKWLQLITQNGTAIVYEVDGKEYLQLVKWWDYQSLQYASPSEYPAPGAWQDRIRYNAKGGMVLTHNWITVKGDTLPDTCDNRGNPISTTPVIPPSQSPENPPGTPLGGINKDQLNTNKDQETAAGAPAAAATEPTDLQRVWICWDKNMPGTRTPVIVDGVNGWLDDYSVAEIEEAISIACKKNKRNFSYVNGILTRGAFSERPKPSGGDYPPQHRRSSNRGLNAAMDYMEDRGMLNGRN